MYVARLAYILAEENLTEISNTFWQFSLYLNMKTRSLSLSNVFVANMIYFYKFIEVQIELSQINNNNWERAVEIILWKFWLLVCKTRSSSRSNVKTYARAEFNDDNNSSDVGRGSDFRASSDENRSSDDDDEASEHGSFVVVVFLYNYQIPVSLY